MCVALQAAAFLNDNCLVTCHGAACGRAISSNCSYIFCSHCFFSWLAALPKGVGGGNLGDSADETEDGDALHRCLCREVATGSALLSKVRADLMAVESLCRGEAKATNEVRWGVRTRVETILCPASFLRGVVRGLTFLRKILFKHVEPC